MALPAQLEGVESKLIMSKWKRRVGKHRRQPVTLIRYNGASATIERSPHRGSGWSAHSNETDKRANIPWDMFLRLYEPVEENFMSHITVDSSNLLIEKVGSPKAPVIPAPQFRRCGGLLHRGKSGQPAELVDIAKFSYTNRRYNDGARRLRTECDDCVRYRNSLPSSQAGYVPRGKDNVKEETSLQEFVPLEDEANGSPEPTKSLRPLISKADNQGDTGNGYGGPEGTSRWLVTVIKEVTIPVWALDFLDAASKVEKDGEIVKVERV